MSSAIRCVSDIVRFCLAVVIGSDAAWRIQATWAFPGVGTPWGYMATASVGQGLNAHEAVKYNNSDNRAADKVL